jgi:signal transduction histidine kinase
MTVSDQQPAFPRKTDQAILQERTEQLVLLRDVAIMANESSDVDAAIRYCLRVISEHNGWCFGHAFLTDEDDTDVLVSASAWYEQNGTRFASFHEATAKSRLRRGEGLPGAVLETGEPRWTNDVSRELNPDRATMAKDLNLHTGFAFPILVGEKTVGVLEFFSDDRVDFNKKLMSPMASIGAILGRVIERADFHRQMIELARIEQDRVYSDLHDSVCQELAGVAMVAETLAKKLRLSGSDEAERASSVTLAIRKVLNEIRQTAHAMLRLGADSSALKNALDTLCKSVRERHSVDCRAEIHLDQGYLDPDRAMHCYRIAQEAVSNSLRHGKAKRIIVSLAAEDSSITLSIHDDGLGLPEGFAGRGVGLRTMRRRARMLGGHLAVKRMEPAGTLVQCIIPKVANAYE